MVNYFFFVTKKIAHIIGSQQCFLVILTGCWIRDPIDIAIFVVTMVVTVLKIGESDPHLNMNGG